MIVDYFSSLDYFGFFLSEECPSIFGSWMVWLLVYCFVKSLVRNWFTMTLCKRSGSIWHCFDRSIDLIRWFSDVLSQWEVLNSSVIQRKFVVKMC